MQWHGTWVTASPRCQRPRQPPRRAAPLSPRSSVVICARVCRLHVAQPCGAAQHACSALGRLAALSIALHCTARSAADDGDANQARERPLCDNQGHSSFER